MQFLPIPGLIIADSTPEVVFTADTANTVVTGFAVIAPLDLAGTADVEIHRVPSGDGPSDQTLLASQQISAGGRIDLRNIFMANDSTLQVSTTVAGVVASGNYSRT